MTNHSLRKFAIFAVGLSCLGFAPTAHASTGASIVVNTLQDGSIAGACTLRDAITAANTSAPVNGCAAGVAGTNNTITFSISGTVVLSSTLPDIASTITIDGGNAMTISGNNAVRIVQVDNSPAMLNLQNLTLSNAADNAVYIVAGTLNVNTVAFIGNSSPDCGGAIANPSGTVTVANSTFSGNNALCGGAITNSGQLTVVNSTFSGNSASAEGGGIANGGDLTVVNSTFSGNSVSAPGAGGGIANSLLLILENTIVANSSGGDCSNDGGLNSSGVNLIGDGSCSVPGALSGDPMLSPLANTGGRTMTHALLPGSPAIDAGDESICTASPVNNLDQRGYPRPDPSGSGNCDIGAFEYQAPIPFTGFFQPVANPPTVNVVKAGQAVAINFSLGSNLGLNILAPGSPASQQVACSSGAPLDIIQQTITAGGSSLSYSATSNTYTYVWKTSSAWAGTCRQFTMTLTDNSVHNASFQFK